MIFLAAVAVLLVVHALWFADRSERAVRGLLEQQIAEARDERLRWNEERLSLLARQDALHVPPMGYENQQPTQPFPAVSNATEDGELAMIEEYRKRASLLGENL